MLKIKKFYENEISYLATKWKVSIESELEENGPHFFRNKKTSGIRGFGGDWNNFSPFLEGLNQNLFQKGKFQQPNKISILKINLLGMHTNLG
ncbi:hypothetical protein Aoki45_08800 [Algoriphagus sp. oki45]|nr:hypothetical protein Aoki45_08800 [Algoriphagus sp. oki45]